jgi:hypothetical protein
MRLSNKKVKMRRKSRYPGPKQVPEIPDLLLLIIENERLSKLANLLQHSYALCLRYNGGTFKFGE